MARANRRPLGHSGNFRVTIYRVIYKLKYFMFDKSTLSILLSGLVLILLGIFVAMPSPWNWVVSLFGLAVMMYAIAPFATRKNKK